MTTPRRPDAPTPRDRSDIDQFATPGRGLDSFKSMNGTLLSAGRCPAWLLSFLLLWIAWPQRTTAAPRIESPVTRLLFRPIGTNEPPLLATQRLEELCSRLRTSARPGSEPTESMIKEHMLDLEKYLRDWPDSPWNPSVRDELARLNVEEQ